MGEWRPLDVRVMDSDEKFPQEFEYRITDDGRVETRLAPRPKRNRGLPAGWPATGTVRGRGYDWPL